MTILKLLNGAAIRDNTKAYRDFIESQSETKTLTTAERKRLEAAKVIAESNFGCQKEAVKSLVGVILGGDLPDITSDFTPPDIGVIVYWLEEKHVCLILEKDNDNDLIPTFSNGTSRGYIAANSHDYRPATEEEVDWFLEEAGIS